MSWRVPARPREAASTPARRTSTPLPTRTPPKLSWETRRSWRSSLRTWIKCWRRCEMWFWWRVWRGGPTADEPRASLMQPLLLCLCHPPPAQAAARPVCCPAPHRGNTAPAACRDSSGHGTGNWAVMVARQVPAGRRDELSLGVPRFDPQWGLAALGTERGWGWGVSMSLVKPEEKPRVILGRIRLQEDRGVPMLGQGSPFPWQHRSRAVPTAAGPSLCSGGLRYSPCPCPSCCCKYCKKGHYALYRRDVFL